MSKVKMETKVRYWLETHPKMRGNKQELLTAIWWNELPEHLKTEEVTEVLLMIATKQLSSPETIMRSMRKVLETRDAWRSNAKYEPPKKQTLDDVNKSLTK